MEALQSDQSRTQIIYRFDSVVHDGWWIAWLIVRVKIDENGAERGRKTLFCAGDGSALDCCRGAENRRDCYIEVWSIMVVVENCCDSHLRSFR